MISRYYNYLIFKFKNITTKVGLNTIISKGTKVGKNCKIGDYCKLSKTTKLFDRIIISDFSFLNNITIGNDSFLSRGVVVVGSGEGQISIGKNSFIGINNILDDSDNINIGDYVHIAGPSTALWCHSSVEMARNSIKLFAINRSDYRKTSPIIIENNVYIGGNCTIYPGVKIGHHSIVAPNSVVTKDLPPHSKVGGVPAKDLNNE